MLFLRFIIDDARYLLEAKDIIEIVPYAHLTRIQKAPHYVAGLLNYRGDTVPVIDIRYLMTGKFCELKLSTRIALVNYNKETGESNCLGLLMEHLTETIRFNEDDFTDSGVNLKGDPYLGKVTMDGDFIVQLINIRKIISEEVCEVLFE